MKKKESAYRGHGMRKCKVFGEKILPDFKLELIGDKSIDSFERK
jgi:hypothetical protein